MCQPHSRAEGDKMNYMDLLVCFCCCFGVGLFGVFYFVLLFFVCLFIWKVFVFFCFIFLRTLSEIRLLGKLGRLWDLREGKEYDQNILSKKLKIIILKSQEKPVFVSGHKICGH